MQPEQPQQQDPYQPQPNNQPPQPAPEQTPLHPMSAPQPTYPPVAPTTPPVAQVPPAPQIPQENWQPVQSTQQSVTPPPEQQPSAQSSQSFAQSPPPLQQPSQPLGSTPGGSYIPPSDSSNTLKKLLVLIPSLLALIGIVGGLLYFFVIVPNQSKVALSDLVEGTLDDTTFKYPKQWKKANGDNSYGDNAEANKRTAAVGVAKSEFVQANITKIPESTISQYRELFLKNLTDESLQELSKGDDALCNDFKDIKKEAYTKKGTHSVGIAKISLNCTVGKTAYKASFVLTLNDDGYLRVIALAALDSYWEQNEASYNAILESAKQAK